MQDSLPDVPLKGLVVREFFESRLARRRWRSPGQKRGLFVDVSDEFLDEGHLIVVCVADAVPLQHREFRIVKPPAFALPKRSGELKNRRRTGNQQPLHAGFRRGLKKERLASNLRCHRFEVGIDDDVVRKQRRFAFPVTVLDEERPHQREQHRTLLQGFESGRRTKGHNEYTKEVAQSGFSWIMLSPRGTECPMPACVVAWCPGIREPPPVSGVRISRSSA